jgi:hypothetical protein
MKLASQSLRSFLFSVAGLACVSYAAAAQAQQTWTVDDNGPADFPSVNAALAQVADGDVLLVQPGSYPAFQLNKALSILGPAGGPKPAFAGLSSADHVAHVLLAGLQFELLAFDSIAGRAQLDACTFQKQFGSSTLAKPSLAIDACPQVVVSRCTVIGTKGGGSAAMVVTASGLSLDDCSVLGGAGQTSEQDGQTALQVQGSVLWLAGTSVLGGSGGQGGGLCSYCHGLGGNGILALNSTVTIRGSTRDLVKPGLLQWDGSFGYAYGLSATNSTIVASGAVIASQHLVNSTLLAPSIPEPFATLGGSDMLARRLLLHGPAGALGIVALALAPAQLALPGLEGLIWLDPASIALVHPLVTQGQDAPSAWLLPVPPLAGLAGVTLWLQAGFPTLPGTIDPNSFLLTNSVQLVLRF